MPYFSNQRDYIYGPNGMVAQMDWEDNRTLFAATDHLGHTRVLFDGTGYNEVLDFAPFGEQNVGPEPPGTTHLFTGHERDGATTSSELDYMHARYYSSDLGRFMSVDPVGGSVGSSQGWNRYSYVQNNPLVFVDPTGEEIQISNEDDLKMLQHAMDDEELAAQLTMETVTEEHSFLGISWTTSKTVVSNGGADWSNSSNPNAQLLGAAINTDTQISFSVTGDDLSQFGGAVMNSIAFSSDNKLSIQINPAQASQTMVPGPNEQRINVPVGVGVIHEFGHAWGHFEKGAYGGAGGRMFGGSTDSHAVGWENKSRQHYFSIRNRPYVPRIRHNW